LWDWIVFTGAHILRASDVLDILEEFQLNFQNVRHATSTIAIILMSMHWLVDVFLITWIIYTIKRVFHSDRFLVSQKHQIFMLLLLATNLVAVGITAKVQSWDVFDIFILWPLDNIIRVLDMGDSFQLWYFHLYQAPIHHWNSVLAIWFRLCMIYYLGDLIQKSWIKMTGGFGLTLQYWIQALESEDPNLQIQAIHKLGELGKDAQEAAPALIQALNHDHNLYKAIIEALRNMRAVSGLMQLLTYADRKIGIAAAEALGNIGYNAQDAMPSLIQMSAADDSHLRFIVQEALAQIDPEWAKSQAAKDAIPAILYESFLNQSKKICLEIKVLFDRMLRFPVSLQDTIRADITWG